MQPVVYGPVDSRRYGRSLGVNPLPPDVKYCDYDCGYCQLGWTDPERMRAARLPSVEDIARAVETTLDGMRTAGEPLDHICIAGNGEPTLHPGFLEIVEHILRARDRHYPGVKVSVLSNGTTAHAPRVRAALLQLDEAVLKLDAGTPGMLRRVDLPAGRPDLERLVDAISSIPGCTVQTLFHRGPVDNTTDEEIGAWIGLLRRCRPAEVQIYSLDRVPADPRLLPVPPEDLEGIAERVRRETGLAVSVF